MSTVITLFLGVAYMHVLLFGTVLAGAATVISPDYLQQTLGHPVDAGDYLTLAWLATSMGLVAGALGSGLETEHAVRRATYSRRQRERHEFQRRQEQEAEDTATGGSPHEEGE